ARPWLMAISAGGPAAFTIYNSAPTKFSGLVSLASSPEPSDIAAARGNVRILMINGAKDDRFPIEYVRDAVSQLRPRVSGLDYEELAGADHFFLLTRPEKAFAVMKDFMGARR